MRYADAMQLSIKMGKKFPWLATYATDIQIGLLNNGFGNFRNAVYGAAQAAQQQAQGSYQKVALSSSQSTVQPSTPTPPSQTATVAGNMSAIGQNVVGNNQSQGTSPAQPQAAPSAALVDMVKNMPQAATPAAGSAASAASTSVNVAE